MTGAFGPRCDDDELALASTGSGSLLVSDIANSSIREFIGITTLDSTTETDPSLTGSLTRLTRPGYLFVHPTTRKLVVPDQGTSAILFFSDPTEREGNVPPDRILSGPGTELSGPVMVYVDSSTDELYVLDQASSRILVYNDASTVEGEVAPNRRIGGATSAISSPNAFFFRASSEQLSVINPSEILTFESFRTANGDPAPSGRVSGPATTFSNLTFGELTDSGTLILVDSGTDQIISFESWVFDENNTAPTRIIAGNNVGLSEPRQFALLDDTMYLADSGNVLVFADILTLEGNDFPTRRFSGVSPNTQTLQGLVFP